MSSDDGTRFFYTVTGPERLAYVELGATVALDILTSGDKRVNIKLGNDWVSVYDVPVDGYASLDDLITALTWAREQFRR